MFEETIPPYRQFDPALAESIQATAKQIRKVLTKHFNQEKPMNECQTPKPAYKPGDHVYVIDKSMWETHAFMKKYEVVFIGFDPEQPSFALVRDVGNLDAPIRTVHSSYIKALQPKPVEHVMDCIVYAARDRIYTTNLANLKLNDLAERRTSYETKKAVDAMVTKDGIVLIKYIDQPVEEAAMVAAHKNPTMAFCSARRSVL